jgi:hypothetical protein
MHYSELAKQIITTAEVMGAQLSPESAGVMALDLADHPPEHVAAALTRCRREGKGRLTLAAILERLPGQHIGADEAWALCPRSEDDTVVWTEQIAQAHAIAAPMLDYDHIGACLAFKGAYVRLVQEARERRLAPQWVASLGHDPRGRERPLRDAVVAGRLPADFVERCLTLRPGEGTKRLPSGEPATLADVIPWDRVRRMKP